MIYKEVNHIKYHFLATTSVNSRTFRITFKLLDSAKKCFLSAYKYLLSDMYNLEFTYSLFHKALPKSGS